MIPKTCPNYKENLQRCPCKHTDCPRRGFCCECVKYHHAAGTLTACEEAAGLARPGTVAEVPSESEPEQAKPFRLIDYAACAG